MCRLAAERHGPGGDAYPIHLSALVFDNMEFALLNGNMGQAKAHVGDRDDGRGGWI
jgi:hypothetical protein